MDKSAVSRALGMLDVLAEYTEDGKMNTLIVNVIETLEKAIQEDK